MAVAVCNVVLPAGTAEPSNVPPARHARSAAPSWRVAWMNTRMTTPQHFRASPGRIASLLLAFGLHAMALALFLTAPSQGPTLELPAAPVVTVALIESAPVPVPSRAVTPSPPPLKKAQPTAKKKPRRKLAITEPRLAVAETSKAVPESAPASPRPPAATVSGGEAAPIIPPDLAAAYRDNPAPPYPGDCRDRGEDGRVYLRVRIGIDGRAELVEIARSSGYSRLDETAREAVSRWRFVPAKQAGQPIAATVHIPIVFHLDG